MRENAADERIIALFFARDEEALRLTRQKHGGLIASVCAKITGNAEDADECESDVYLAVWNRIPPDKPNNLPAYLTRIARNISISKLRKTASQKRGSKKNILPYEELADVFPGGNETEEEFDRTELTRTLNRFLAGLPTDDRRLFVLRYFRESSVEELSKMLRISKQGVYFRLNELKNKLKEALEKEGYLP